MQSPEKSAKAWRRTWSESKGDHNGGSSVAKEFVTEKTSFQCRGSSVSPREVGPERQFSPGLAAKKNAGLLGVGVGVSRLGCGWSLDGSA